MRDGRPSPASTILPQIFFVKTNRLKSFFSNPLVGAIALLVTPICLYNWAQDSIQERNAALEQPGWVEDTTAAGQIALARTTIVNAPGVTPDRFEPVDTNAIRNADEVIGVIVEGVPRAYLLEAACPLRNSVVNDVLAGRPISVIYDSNTTNLRVLTSPTSNADSSGACNALDISVVGLRDNGLFLSYQGDEFFVVARLPVLCDFPFARCTWGVWKAAYPQTDLYTGGLSISQQH